MLHTGLRLGLVIASWLVLRRRLVTSLGVANSNYRVRVNVRTVNGSARNSPAVFHLVIHRVLTTVNGTGVHLLHTTTGRVGLVQYWPGLGQHNLATLVLSVTWVVLTVFRHGRLTIFFGVVVVTFAVLDRFYFWTSLGKCGKFSERQPPLLSFFGLVVHKLFLVSRPVQTGWWFYVVGPATFSGGKFIVAFGSRRLPHRGIFHSPVRNAVVISGRVVLSLVSAPRFRELHHVGRLNASSVAFRNTRRSHFNRYLNICRVAHHVYGLFRHGCPRRTPRSKL